MFDERVFPYSPQGGIQVFRRALSHSLVFTPRFSVALCTMPKVLSWIAQYLCVKNLAYMDFLHWLLRRSGSVPTEIAEPTREAQSSRHVCIETMQSKDFSENLVICVNFQTQSTDIQYLDSKIIYTISMRIRYFIGVCYIMKCGAGAIYIFLRKNYKLFLVFGKRIW